jgi:hypothetical protein
LCDISWLIGRYRQAGEKKFSGLAGLDRVAGRLGGDRDGMLISLFRPAMIRRNELEDIRGWNHLRHGHMWQMQ